MNNEEIQHFCRLQPEFLNALEPNDVTSHLLADGNWTSNDYERIKNQLQTTRQDRVTMFVDIAKRKLDSLECLVKPLEAAGYHGLARNICVGLELDENGILFDAPRVMRPAWPVRAAVEKKYESTLIDLLKKFYKDFSEIALIPEHPRSIVCLDTIYINLVMKDFRGLNSKINYDLCLEYAQETNKPIIVQGEPGGGKSTLVKKICLDWAKGKLPYQFVLMARLREVEKASDFLDICIKWLFNTGCLSKLRQEEAEQCVRTVLYTDPSKVLLILDGLDEAVTECNEIEQLYQKGFVQCRHPVIITTRPYKVFEILCDHKISYIQNLDWDQQKEFATKYFTELQTPQKEQETFLNQLENNKDLQAALGAPLLLQLALICGYVAKKYRQTDLYKELIVSLMATFNQNHPQERLDLSENWLFSVSAVNLGKLAFHKLLEKAEGVLIFSEEDLETYGIDNRYLRMGILRVEESWTDLRGKKPKKIFSFLHKTFQEFFAATAVAADEAVESAQPESLQLNNPEPECKKRRKSVPLLKKDKSELHHELQSIVSGISFKESWKAISLQQNFLFLCGIFADMGKDFQFFELFFREEVEMHVYEPGKFWETLCSEALPDAKNINLLVSKALHLSHDMDEVITESLNNIFTAAKSELKNYRCECPGQNLQWHWWHLSDQTPIRFLVGNLEIINYSQPYETKSTLESFSHFALEGSESMLKEIFDYLPEEIKSLTLNLSHESTSAKNKVIWLRPHNIELLSIDMSACGWTMGCSALLKASKLMQKLRILGNQTPVDLGLFIQIPNTDCLTSLCISNVDIKLGSLMSPVHASTYSMLKNLQSLHLVNCHLSAEGFLPWLDFMVSQEQQIQSLSFNNNNGIAKDAETFEKMCAGMSKLPALVSLYLPWCGLLDCSVKPLKSLVLSSKSLETLYLGFNRFNSVESIANLCTIARTSNVRVHGVHQVNPQYVVEQPRNQGTSIRQMEPQYVATKAGVKVKVSRKNVGGMSRRLQLATKAARKSAPATEGIRRSFPNAKWQDEEDSGESESDMS